MAAYDPTLQMLYINNPIASASGTYTNGLVALILNNTSCTLALAWQSTFGAGVLSGSTVATDPVVAGGVVWVVTGAGKSVLAFNEVGGALLWSSNTAMKSPTTTPATVVDGQMFVQSGTKLYAWGL
jgi:outer membrane protein assembly factor BamB